jgi:nitrite reductase/ring-hydroxylating ferredoxin subunit
MHKLCDLSDLPNNDSKGFTINETTLFIIRKNNDVFAYLNQCPHLGVRLDWQPDKFLNYEKEFIQCSTHGALFLIETGKCIAGPCSGCHLPKIHTLVKDGSVHINFDNKGSD